MKKTLSLLLAALLLFALPACGKKEETSSAEASSQESPPAKAPVVLGLPYSSTDSMSPYAAATTMNLSLMPLLFERLVTVGDDFKPVNQMALSVSVEGGVCTVVLQEGLLFSDASEVTAADVVYSIESAMKDGSFYKARLSNVKKVRAQDGKTVVFELHTPDVLFANALDVPIIKNKTADHPVGSGKFALSQEGGEASLIPNAHHKTPPVEGSVIRLASTPDYQTTLHSLEIGAVNCFFDDLSNGSIPSLDANLAPVATTSLVYLGIQSARPAVSNPAVKKVLQAKLDKEAAVASAYNGRAAVAQTIFPPGFYALGNTTIPNPAMSDAMCVQALEEAGFDKTGSDRVRKNEANERLSFELIVSDQSANRKAVAAQLQNALKPLLIELKITALPFADFQKRLSEGNFDLYLSEIKLTDNLSAELTLDPAGSGYGAAADNASLLSFRSYRSGEITIQEFLDAFANDLPLIPVCYRQALVIYNRGLKGDMNPGHNNVFFNIENWTLGS